MEDGKPDAAAARSVKSLTAELLSAYEELAVLHSLAAKIGPLAHENEIAAVALTEAVEALRADCGWVALWRGEKLQSPDGCRLHIDEKTVERILAAAVEPLRTNRKSQLLSHNLPEEYGLQEPGAPERFMACSLPAGSVSRGYLCVGRRQGRIFTSADQKLISAVASLAAVSLENVRLRRAELEKARLQDELELARAVQQGLLPRDFTCCGFLEADAASLPCYAIGGDYFDLLAVGPGQCLLVMADVAGKGPAAALQAAMLQGIVHAFAGERPDLSRLIGQINECVRLRAVPGNFATVVAGTLDAAGRLRYINGGHNPPLWIRARGELRELTEGGPLLGFLEHAVFREGSIVLDPSDLLVFYTDGVTEAVNPAGQAFGVRRILDWGARQAGRSPAEVRQSLIETVMEFCAGRAQADDLTVMVVRFTGRGRDSI